MSEDKPDAKKNAASIPQVKEKSAKEATKSAKKTPASNDAANKKARAALKPTPPKSNRNAMTLAVLAILVASASALGGYLISQQIQSLQQQQQSYQARQAQQHSDSITALRNDMQQIQPALQTSLNAAMQQSLEDVRGQLTGRLEQELGSLQGEIATLRSNKQPAEQPDWIIAEAEYLIRIANHRLQLEYDIDMGIMALALADERLRSLSRPQVLVARRHLADEIAQLKALPRLDIEGMSLTLSSLQKRIAALPLNTPDREQEGQSVAASGQAQLPGWRRFVEDVWETLKTLVAVRRIDPAAQALVTPEQRMFLNQNLALKLEAARYALLRRDNRSYHDSLQTALDWLQHYFDGEADAVKAMREALLNLDKHRLGEPLPLITGSLQALQAVANETGSESR